MSLTAKTKLRSKHTDRHRQRAIAEVSRGVSNLQTGDRLVFQEHAERERDGAPKKPPHEKARLATFSLTPEDLHYVERATYQVIQALETGVSKSHAVRLAVRVFANISVEELRNLLHRIYPPT